MVFKEQIKMKNIFGQGDRWHCIKGILLGAVAYICFHVYKRKVGDMKYPSHWSWTQLKSLKFLYSTCLLRKKKICVELTAKDIEISSSTNLQSCRC